jgi:hypothetical protein
VAHYRCNPVDRGGPYPRSLGLGDLVPHQQEQRRDDHGRTAAPRAQQDGRQEVDGGLPHPVRWTTSASIASHWSSRRTAVAPARRTRCRWASNRSSARELSSTNEDITSGHELAATMNGQQALVLASEAPDLGATSLGERRFASTEATPRPDCPARNAWGNAQSSRGEPRAMSRSKSPADRR